MTQNPTWRKSSYSGAGNNDCVELLLGGPRTKIRDSKNPAAGELTLTATPYRAFLATVRQSLR
jgi:hypothetical protein